MWIKFSLLKQRVEKRNVGEDVGNNKLINKYEFSTCHVLGMVLEYFRGIWIEACVCVLLQETSGEINNIE